MNKRAYWPLEKRLARVERLVDWLLRRWTTAYNLLYARTRRRSGAERRAIWRLKAFERRVTDSQRMVRQFGHLQELLGRDRGLVTLSPEQLSRLHYLLGPRVRVTASSAASGNGASANSCRSRSSRSARV